MWPAPCGDGNAVGAGINAVSASRRVARELVRVEVAAPLRGGGSSILEEKSPPDLLVCAQKICV